MANKSFKEDKAPSSLGMASVREFEFKPLNDTHEKKKNTRNEKKKLWKT